MRRLIAAETKLTLLDPAMFVLIHSPLVGPATWAGVAGELQRRGYPVVVPVLHDTATSSLPYWQQHAQAVADTMAALPAEQPLILAGHSGAGPILPVIRAMLAQQVIAYVFVDAGLPHPNASRLDLIAIEAPEWVDQFRQILTAGGRFPTWSEEDLMEELPDVQLRRRVVAELQPRDLAFFSEPLPVFAEWPDAICAYLQFSSAYAVPAAAARQAGWPVQTLAAGHFHPLDEPAAVATALIQLVAQARASGR